MPVQLSITARSELVKKKLEDLTGEVPKVAEGRFRGRLVAAQVRLSRYPGRYAGQPKHHWASEKQRRYVMWAISTGAIKVPYQRTGRYGNSWKIEKIKQGYRLSSNYPAARWVAGTARGDPQYHIHQTRWAALRPTVEEVMKELPENVRKDILMVARRKGFQTS